MTYFMDLFKLVVWLVWLTSGQVGPGLKFRRPSRTDFRVIIYVTSWAGYELQRVGPGRVNKIRAVQVLNFSNQTLSIMLQSKR